jgi:protein-S-isoprenylcysteine O-methyltransferase Ste14
VILLSLAWALWWRSIPGLGLAAAMFVFLDAKARHEERRLQRKFPDYADYARHVRRLLPWVY